jgi:hypothetical protein
MYDGHCTGVNTIVQTLLAKKQKLTGNSGDFIY